MHIVLYAFFLIALSSLSGCVSVSSQKASPAQITKAQVNLSAEYYRLGRLEPALVAAKKAIAANKKSVAANSMLALIYQSLEEPALADEYFTNAVRFVAEDSGEFGMVHNNYAVFLCRNNRAKEAETHFLLAAKSKLYNTPQDAYENAGLCLLQEGKVKAAKAKKAAVYFRKALSLSPQLPRSLFALAKSQYNAGEYASARTYLQRYHAVSAGSAKSLYMAMMVEQKLGDSEQALRIKTELKKRFPDSQEVSMSETLR